MNKLHEVENVYFDEGSLCLTVDGKKISKKLEEVSKRLASASDEARLHFEISPSGYGIHWPDCDEDLSIDALLGIRHDAPAMAAEEPVEYKTKK